MDRLEAAFAYAAAGWYVLPLDKRSKSPGSILGKHWQTQSSRDPQVLASWWAGSNHGVALHVGRSHAVAFDIDTPANLPDDLRHALAVSDPPFQSTRKDVARRGHAVFRQPPGRRLGNSLGSMARGWGEIRGLNGVIVVEPTPHVSALLGGQYTWLKTGVVPLLPDEIAQQLPDIGASEAPASTLDVRAFLDTFHAGDTTNALGPLRKFEQATLAGGSRHDAAVASAVWIAKEARAGLVSAQQGLAMLRDLFVRAATDAARPGQLRTPSEAKAEFDDVVSWAVAQAMGMTDDEVERTRAIAGRKHAESSTPGAAGAQVGGTAQVFGVPAPRRPLDDAAPTAAAATSWEQEVSGDDRAENSTAAVVPGDEPTQNYNEFWEARAELAHIRQAAQSRLTGPWSTLGVVLARVVTATSHEVYLPAIIGGPASLNVFVALVAPSGLGKGASESLARDLVPGTGAVHEATPGSGEGLAHAYASRKGKDIERHRDAVLFTVPEVDQLVSLGMRRMGATLLPQLRSAWSGERLGFAYADASRNIPIEGQSYRLCLLVGVQPLRAQALLDDADGGTPQRFLWLPTHDPTLPDSLPEWPGPLAWAKRGWTRGGIVVPDIARSTIINDRRERLRTGESDLDAHSLLARLKAAAALGVLAGRHEVTEEDWQLAEILMEVSTATRGRIETELRARTSQQAFAAALAEGDKQIIVADRVTATTHERMAETLLRRLASGPLPETTIRRTTASRDRGELPTVLAALASSGRAALVDGEWQLCEPSPMNA